MRAPGLANRPVDSRLPGAATEQIDQQEIAVTRESPSIERVTNVAEMADLVAEARGNIFSPGIYLAETEGFEPSVPVRGLHLSRVVH